MVVLDVEDIKMLGSGPNQYLSPDYLPPLSSSLDSKVSPLALLAQTCSSIGSDGPSAKSIFDTSSKRKLSTCSESSVKSDSSDSSSKDTVITNSKDSFTSSMQNNRSKSNNSSALSPVSTPLSASVRSNNNGVGGGGKISPIISPSSVSPVFKPYELSSKKDNASEKSGSKTSGKNNSSSVSKQSSNSSPKLKTVNPRSSTPKEQEISVIDSKPKSKVSSSGGENNSSSSSSNGGGGGSDPPKSSSSSEHRGESPIIRSGLEVLQQGQFGVSAAEYAKYSQLSSLAGMRGYPPGFDQLPLNPAFRPPFVGGLGGYPVHYTRVKTVSGETIVPVCKDPYCQGCQFGGGGVPHGTAASAHASAAAAGMNGLMAAAVAAAAARYPPTSVAGYQFPPNLPSPLSPGFPSSLLSQHASSAAAASESLSAAQQNAQKPFVCSWIAGENYCGKRFPSSEELLQHLRTHTNSSTAASSAGAPPVPTSESSIMAAALLQQQQLLASALSSPSGSLYSAFLNPSTMGAFHRSYPTPPLSPMSASRYHPYAAAGKLLPPPHTLGSYYPYSG